MDFFIKTEYNIIFTIVIIIVSVLIAFIYYRNSNLSRSARIFFTTLRSLTLFFILLLLASPVVSFISSVTIQPVNIFLVDNSRSLELEQRYLQTDSIYRELKGISSSGTETNFFEFSSDIGNEAGDSVIFFGINNNSTDLTKAMINLEERYSSGNISTITVISDGMFNEGGNPVFTARQLGASVNYLLVGDTVQKNDVLVKNVFYNRSAFIESNVPIKADINSFGYNQTVTVNLYEEDVLQKSQTITLSKEKSVYNVDFDITSLSPGVKKYKVEVTELNGEITTKNNYEEFFIKFVDNKFRVLVLSGAPSSDFAFIKEEIQKIQNFETTFLTQKGTNSYYEGAVPNLNGFQAFIFIGYPTSISSPEILTGVKDVLNTQKASLMFFASKNTDYSKLDVLSDNLPFRSVNYSETESETGLRTVSLPDNDAFRNNELLATISSLPNIFKSGTNFTANPSSETLVLTTSGEPAFVIQNTEDNHSAAMLMHGLYKWRLSPRKTNGSEILNSLLAGTISYISDKERQKKFFIETSRPVYSKYEEVVFNAELNDPVIIGGEEIKIKINGGNINEELTLVKINNTTFTGKITVPADGDYKYTATLSIRNEQIESDEGRFLIGENNYEFKNTRSNKDILSSLSNETGGKNLTGLPKDEIVTIIEELNKKESEAPSLSGLRNFSLNINPYFLGILILLLSIEWFLRKRNNLP